MPSVRVVLSSGTRHWAEMERILPYFDDSCERLVIHLSSCICLKDR